MDTLSIVMPAYNEQDCVQRVVTSWLEVFKKVKGTLIVVNDGSKDRTLEILHGLAEENSHLKIIDQPNAGHGAALIRGYREAVKLKTTYIFQTDSDDQFLVQ